MSRSRKSRKEEKRDDDEAMTDNPTATLQRREAVATAAVSSFLAPFCYVH